MFPIDITNMCTRSSISETCDISSSSTSTDMSGSSSNTSSSDVLTDDKMSSISEILSSNRSDGSDSCTITNMYANSDSSVVYAADSSNDMIGNGNGSSDTSSGHCMFSGNDGMSACSNCDICMNGLSHSSSSGDMYNSSSGIRVSNSCCEICISSDFNFIGCDMCTGGSGRDISATYSYRDFSAGMSCSDIFSSDGNSEVCTRSSFSDMCTSSNTNMCATSDINDCNSCTTIGGNNSDMYANIGSCDISTISSKSKTYINGSCTDVCHSGENSSASNSNVVSASSRGTAASNTRVSTGGGSVCGLGVSTRSRSLAANNRVGLSTLKRSETNMINTATPSSFAPVCTLVDFSTIAVSSADYTCCTLPSSTPVLPCLSFSSTASTSACNSMSSLSSSITNLSSPVSPVSTSCSFLYSSSFLSPPSSPLSFSSLPPLAPCELSVPFCASAFPSSPLSASSNFSSSAIAHSFSTSFASSSTCPLSSHLPPSCLEPLSAFFSDIGSSAAVSSSFPPNCSAPPSPTSPFCSTSTCSSPSLYPASCSLPSSTLPLPPVCPSTILPPAVKRGRGRPPKRPTLNSNFHPRSPQQPVVPSNVCVIAPNHVNNYNSFHHIDDINSAATAITTSATNTPCDNNIFGCSSYLCNDIDHALTSFGSTFGRSSSSASSFCPLQLSPGGPPFPSSLSLSSSSCSVDPHGGISDEGRDALSSGAAEFYHQHLLPLQVESDCQSLKLESDSQLLKLENDSQPLKRQSSISLSSPFSSFSSPCPCPSSSSPVVDGGGGSWSCDVERLLRQHPWMSFGVQVSVSVPGRDGPLSTYALPPFAVMADQLRQQQREIKGDPDVFPSPWQLPLDEEELQFPFLPPLCTSSLPPPPPLGSPHPNHYPRRTKGEDLQGCNGGIGSTTMVTRTLSALSSSFVNSSNNGRSSQRLLYDEDAEEYNQLPSRGGGNGGLSSSAPEGGESSGRYAIKGRCHDPPYLSLNGSCMEDPPPPGGLFWPCSSPSCSQEMFDAFNLNNSMISTWGGTPSPILSSSNGTPTTTTTATTTTTSASSSARSPISLWCHDDPFSPMPVASEEVEDVRTTRKTAVSASAVPQSAIEIYQYPSSMASPSSSFQSGATLVSLASGVGKVGSSSSSLLLPSSSGSSNSYGKSAQCAVPTTAPPVNRWKSGVEGVYFDHQKSLWRVQFLIQGKRKTKSFSPKSLGFDQAKQQAIDYKAMMQLPEGSARLAQAAQLGLTLASLDAEDGSSLPLLPTSFYGGRSMNGGAVGSGCCKIRRQEPQNRGGRGKGERGRGGVGVGTAMMMAAATVGENRRIDASADVVVPGVDEGENWENPVGGSVNTQSQEGGRAEDWTYYGAEGGGSSGKTMMANGLDQCGLTQTTMLEEIPVIVKEEGTFPSGWSNGEGGEKRKRKTKLRDEFERMAWQQ